MSMVVYTNVNVSVILGVPCVLSSFEMVYREKVSS